MHLAPFLLQLLQCPVISRDVGHNGHVHALEGWKMQQILGEPSHPLEIMQFKVREFWQCSILHSGEHR